jgi:peroxiredoxin
MTVTLLGGLLAAAAAFVAWLTLQLLAQNGRILGRLERLELLIDAGPPGAGDASRDPRAASLKNSQLLRDGLPEGTAAPEFRLPRIGGGEVTLSQYRGRKVLIVFSDPTCGPCNTLLPKLQRRSASGTDVNVVMISRGDQEANSAKITECGATFPVVLQRRWEISKLYGIFATPIAFLVDEEGTIAAPVAVGPQRILDLIPDNSTLGSWFKPRPKPAQA